MEAFEELLTMFRDSKDNIHISESEFGCEIDSFQGLGLKCTYRLAMIGNNGAP